MPLAIANWFIDYHDLLCCKDNECRSQNASIGYINYLLLGMDCLAQPDFFTEHVQFLQFAVVFDLHDHP